MRREIIRFLNLISFDAFKSNMATPQGGRRLDYFIFILPFLTGFFFFFAFALGLGFIPP